MIRLIAALITAAHVAGFDETTLRAGPAEQKKYVLGAFAKECSLLFLGARSLESFRDFGVLPAFRGVVVSDRYVNYFHPGWEHIAGTRQGSGIGVAWPVRCHLVGPAYWPRRYRGQRRSRMLGRRAGTGLVIVGAAAVYFRFLRQWHLHWGATAQEVRGKVVGDELMPHADIVATRVVEIDAPPSAIWPWLVQMGPGRGGAYTYDWIERRLGIDIRNTDRVIPELQHLKVGDEIPMPGYAMRVERLDPGRRWSSAPATTPGCGHSSCGQSTGTPG